MTKASIKMALTTLAVIATTQGAFSKAFAADPVPSKEIVVSINDAYLPEGQTTESNATAVVNGIFPNGCYRWKEAAVTHVDAFTHEVRSTADVSQGMCIMVLVPFTKEVRFGRLSRGNHMLRFLNGDGTYLEKTLTIK